MERTADLNKNSSPDKNQNDTESQSSWWRSLGPGLITGAADDDPSGIATYSQAGAKFGFDVLWSTLLTYPLMSAVQIISARIGAVSGHGLATHIKNLYPAWLLWMIVFALCVANIINIGADIAAMGDASVLLIHNTSAHTCAVALGLMTLILQIVVPYRRYVNVLKWLTLTVFAYVAALFGQHIAWREVAEHLLHPHWQWRSDYITMVVAVFGTTISPYLFFWQSSEEVEELRRRHQLPLTHSPHSHRNHIRLRVINRDTLIGMAVSNIVAFAIMVCTAVALHAHGLTRIQTSAEAARALQPIAGNAAFLLFTLGIIGTGLLAVPVLAASCAYAISGATNTKASLEHSFREAPAFYTVISIATLIGIALCFTPINPMDALYWSAVINGIVAVPLIGLLVKMAIDVRVMSEWKISPLLKWLGWLTMGIMAAAAIAMLVFAH